MAHKRKSKARGAGATPPWLPTNMGTLEQWYDVETALEPSSGTVTSWTDQSSNGYVLAVTGDPQVGANTINSLPTVTFDGAGDALTVTSVTYGNSHTVVLVAHCLEANGNTSECVFSADAGAQDYQIRNGRTTECRYAINGVAGAEPATDYLTTTVILAIEFDATGGNATVYIDGVQVAQDTGFGGTISATKTVIGANRPVTTFWDGYVADVIHFNASDTDSRQRCEGYLAHKFALTGNLDGGHPYKASPP